MDEFNARWYLLVGTPIVIALILQIVTPHLGVLLQLISKSIERCRDRTCTSNYRVTKKVIQ